MTVYLVRHVKAGSRHDWDGPDAARPISKSGRQQADALGERLGGEPIKRVVSSPYVRCVQSVQPLADRLGLVVETSDALAEGADVRGAIDLVDAIAADNGVLCSHGDVIPAVLDELIHVDGLRLPHDFPFAKGSVWVLDGDTRPFTSAHYVEAS